MSGTRGSDMPSLRTGPGANRDSRPRRLRAQFRQSVAQRAIARLRRVERGERGVGIGRGRDALQRRRGIGDLRLGADVLRQRARVDARPARLHRIGDDGGGQRNVGLGQRLRRGALEVGIGRRRRGEVETIVCGAREPGDRLSRASAKALAFDPKRRPAALGVDGGDAPAGRGPVGGADGAPGGLGGDEAFETRRRWRRRAGPDAAAERLRTAPCRSDGGRRFRRQVGREPRRRGQIEPQARPSLRADDGDSAGRRVIHIAAGRARRRRRACVLAPAPRAARATARTPRCR